MPRKEVEKPEEPKQESGEEQVQQVHDEANAKGFFGNAPDVEGELRHAQTATGEDARTKTLQENAG